MGKEVGGLVRGGSKVGRFVSGLEGVWVSGWWAQVG